MTYVDLLFELGNFFSQSRKRADYLNRPFVFGILCLFLSLLISRSLSLVDTQPWRNLPVTPLLTH